MWLKGRSQDLLPFSHLLRLPNSISSLYGGERYSSNKNNVAWAIAKRSGNDDWISQEGPSEHWWQLFKKRHPQIVLRKSDNLERTRAEAFNIDIVTEYFEMLSNIDLMALMMPYMRKVILAG